MSILILILIIVVIISILYLGIQISLKINKTDANINYNLKIKILNKITIFKKEEFSKKKENTKPNLSTVKNTIPFLFNYLKNVLQAVNIQKLEGNIKLGLSSYVDTAKYVGYIWSIFIIPNTTIKSCLLTAEPVFSQEIFDFNVELKININLLKLIIPTILLLKEKEIITFIKESRKRDKNE